MTDLDEIDGIGNSIETKLKDGGIETVNALSKVSLGDLEEIGIKGKNAEKILEQAQYRGVPLDSATAVEKEQDNARYIETGLEPLDEILGGGIQGGFIIGVSGEPKAGKTQFVLQMLASAVDYTDEHGVYIETEPNRFHIDRVKSLCREDDSYKRLHRIQAHTDEMESDVDNIELQRNAYDAIRESLDDVALIVVDSFQANFRLSGRYQDRSDLPRRNSDIAEHLKALQSLANHFDCPVLMTLQLMGNPDQFSGSTHDVWGPVLMDHTIAHMIHISHGKGSKRNVEVLAHPGINDDELTIVMPEDAPIEAV